MTETIRIGSRGSALALWQSRMVARMLEAAHPGLTCVIEIIKTTGDIQLDASLVAISGKGAFTKEIEDAMLADRVDLAVHSLKDLPTTLPDGLALVAITEREDPRDAFVGGAGICSLAGVPEGGRIGTSSPRRRAQLLALRPDLELAEIRGNVDTRLRKIESEGLDGIVLACAGLRRLGLADRITEAIDPDVMVPAVGQGALGLEARADDERVARLASALMHESTALACRAERAFLAALGGGCAVPIAAHATLRDDEIRLTAAVGRADGRVTRLEATGSVTDPESLGRNLAGAAH